MKKLFIAILSLLSINGFSQKFEYDSLYRLDKDTMFLNEVVISFSQPYQATALMPITFKNISKTDLSLVNYGQEPSRILSTTPSITTYSESGGDYGYSYIRLRGIDQTRINVTLNGIPMNEPEDQGCYFSNYPDFLQSVETLQIQRGTGMTKNGSASFIGSINFESYNPKENKVGFDFGYGSWNSSKIGIISQNIWKNGGLYLSMSHISSDGYKEHSGNESNSLFMIVNQKYKDNDFKLVGFIGGQSNELAWIGSPVDSININRKHNGCTVREIDNFNQSHVQFHHKYTIADNIYFNWSIFYNHLQGFYTYDGIRDGYDEVYGIHLKSNWVGINWNYFFRTQNLDIYTGVNGYSYGREHRGTIDDGMIVYDTYVNDGNKFDISYYLKGIINVDNINIYGDFQYRYTNFFYHGDAYLESMRYTFPNFTTGVNYKLNHNIFYYSIGQTHREPTRNDIFGGWDNLLSDSLGNAIYYDLEPESVIGQELGYRFIKENISLNANLFYMIFRNELILTGEYGSNGLPLHTNVDKSFRSGVEIDFKYKWKELTLNQNGSFNYSKMKWDGNNITPILTPMWLSNTGFNYQHKWFVIGITGRYQSFSYIDIYDKETIKDFYTINTMIGLKWKWGEWNLYLNNITNQEYFHNGMMSGEIPLYFVGAPFNFYTGIKFNL
jgi:iron complex outermembrane receptor protein